MRKNTALAGLKKIEEKGLEQLSNEQLQQQVLIEQLKYTKEMANNQNKPVFVVYLLLAFFLGGIGAHNFYEGKKATGLLKLATFWTGIPAVIAIFNIIGACMRRDDFK